MKADSVKAVFDELMQQRPADRSFALRFNEFQVLVKTDSSELKKKLCEYFRDFLLPKVCPDPDVIIHALERDPLNPTEMELELTEKTPDPGKTKIKEEFVDLADGRIVRKKLTGMMFLFGSGIHLAVGPCAANDNQVVNFINNRYIEWELNRGALLFHSAAVAKQSDNGLKGLALSGFSGMGKSTLALAIMNLGAVFVSNDRLMVRRDNAVPSMYGVAKMPRINPGTVLHNPSLAPVIPDEEREGFEKLPQEMLWDLEHKYDAFIDDCYGTGRFNPSARMTGLVVLNWRRNNDSLQLAQVDLKDRIGLFPAFMKSAGLFFGSGGKALPEWTQDDYSAVLQNVPVYEITGGIDFETAAALCYDII